MGRHAGWIALHSGLAGGATCILIPEQKFSVDKVCEWVESRFKSHYAPIIVIAEGAIPQDGDMVVKDQTLDSFGHVKLSGIGDWLAKQIEERTGKEARTSVLGHIQRGGTPTAFDRRRKLIVDLINEIPGFVCPTPQGAFYVYPSVKGVLGKTIRGKTPTTSAELATLILEEVEVAAVPGEAFGPSGYLRFSYATSDADIVEGIGRIKKLITEG